MSLLQTIGETVVHSAVNPTAGPVSAATSAAARSVAGFGLQQISSWILGGTKDALQEVARAIGAATAPNLQSTWFSSTYWRVAALAAMLTIPFLCAAALQSVARADLNLLARVVFGYLPLSVLAVSLAAPLTNLMLAATDQMSSAVSASAAAGGARFLDHAGAAALALSGAGGATFFAALVGLFAVIAALALAVELLIRTAAVYVVVLMLPLAFAALVWPARRVWAARLVELLVSLILSKFVIVAVLSLAAAAFAGGDPGISQLLTAMALLLLSTFAPWALMQILPFTELAAGAAGLLSRELPSAHRQAMEHAGKAAGHADAALELPARMRSQAQRMMAGLSGDGDSAASAGATSRSDSREDEPGAGSVGSGSVGSGSVGSGSVGSGSVGSGSVGSSLEDLAAPAAAADARSDSSGTTNTATEPERPRYEPPPGWQRDEPLRLDADLPRALTQVDSSGDSE